MVSAQEFVNDFDNLYNNREIIFELFQGDYFTLDEIVKIFDSLKTKQKCNLYNTIPVEGW